MVDLKFDIIECSLEIAFVKRLVESFAASWKIIPERVLSKYGGISFLASCASMLNYLIYQISEFYHTRHLEMLGKF